MNTIQDAGYTAKGTHQTAEKQAEEAAKAAVQKAAKRRSKGLARPALNLNGMTRRVSTRDRPGQGRHKAHRLGAATARLSGLRAVAPKGDPKKGSGAFRGKFLFGDASTDGVVVVVVAPLLAQLDARALKAMRARRRRPLRARGVTDSTYSRAVISGPRSA